VITVLYLNIYKALLVDDQKREEIGFENGR